MDDAVKEEKSLEALLSERAALDHNASCLLLEMSNDGLLGVQAILHGILGNSGKGLEWSLKTAEHYAQAVNDLVARRRELQMEIARSS